MELVALVARVLFSAMFVMSGLNHLTKRAYLSEYARSMGAPMPELAVPGSGLMILAGGVMVALGVFADLGGLLIAAFLIPTAFIMHPFWKMDGDMAQNQQIHFMKNMTMAGGALALTALAWCTSGYSLTGPLFG